MMSSHNEDALEKKMDGREVYLAGIGSYSPGDPVPYQRAG
jgi:hypothetical protein